MLPSLYKKTGNKFIATKKIDLSLTKNIEGKDSKGDYLTK
jgi:hypothetical protein